MKRVPVIFLIVCASLGADDRQEKALDSRITELQGTWMVLVNDTKDSKTDEEFNKRIDYHMDVEGDRLTWKSKEADEVVRFKIDPTKTPKTLDLDIRKGKPRNLCIYSIEGDILKICCGHFGRARPSTFDVSKTEGVSLIILKRGKR